MTKSKKNRRKKSRVTAESDSRKKRLESLIEEAEAAVDSFSYEDAESKLQEVLEMDPDNVKCLEMLSSVYIEKFQWSEAHNLLERCIELCPERGHSKYFSIAQLCEGLESVAHYEKGIRLLERELEEDENVEPSQEQDKATLRRNLSDAYCSISEIYMSDCCFEENAEEKCTAAIECAVRWDPSNPEAHQCLASYQVVKDQLQEAKESMQKSISLWLPTLEVEGGDANESVAKNPIPVYDSRIKTSKLLMEVQMYDEASRVLESLLGDDDEVVEVWYLFGWLNYIQGGEENKKNARFYFRKAKEVNTKLQQDEEDACMEHVNELLSELDACFPDDSDKENEEEEGDENSFSTDSEEEMET